MFHIPTLKSAMAEVGLVTTDGETMNAKDTAAFYDFAQRFFGLTKIQAAYGLAYPSTITSAIPGHPDNEATSTVALIPPVVFPPPTPKPVIPNINDMANPSEPEEVVPDEVPESDPEQQEEQEPEHVEQEETVAEQE